MQEMLETHPAGDMEPGTRIEVRSRFERSWSRGFEVAEVLGDGRYLVRRLSDGRVLPTEFDEDDVRAEKKNAGMWWY